MANFSNDPFFQGQRSNSPQSIINDKATSLGKTNQFSFPSDLPKYFTLLMEYEWHNPSWENKSFGQLTQLNGYRLPLPTQITDAHEVQYDHGFNWMEASGVKNAVDKITGAVGFSLNTFKYVTLSNPNFRNYAFQWKLLPKSPEESNAIRQIYMGIKRGMHPIRTGVMGVNLGFVFPNIFWLGFYPNADYLVKFKPAVITSCQIDYQGGNPVPTFYKGTEAPESITLNLTFLELELWTRDNFNMAESRQTGAPAEPFNANDWFRTQ